MKTFISSIFSPNLRNVISHLGRYTHKMTGGPWDKGPGDSDDKKNTGPWGKGADSNQKKPANIDEALDLVQRRLKQTFNQGGGSQGGPEISRSLVMIVLFGILVLWGLTGFFRVQEGELAVVTRFGELVRISSAGLRYHLPSPVENVIITKVAAVNTIHGGLRDSKGDSENSEQTLILTGDENMVHTDYTVLWKVKDVTEFLFTARQPEVTIKVAAESVIREVVGQTTARAALTEGRDSIGAKSQVLLQKLMDQYKLGIQIVSIQLQNVAPPRDVIESFNGLQASLTDADRLGNEAEAYGNDIIPRARGQATQIKQDAEAYRQTKIAEAEGEASRFSQVYAAYQKNPGIVMKRYYLATMQEVLEKVNKIVIDPRAGSNILPYLPLGSLPKMPSKQAADKEAGAQR